MKLVKNIMTRNPCYTKGKKMTAIKGIMLHSVGGPQPKASVFIRQWNNPGYSRACVHAFIDATDGTIYQTLPWNYRGWHCGRGCKGSGNQSYIGVEMCEPSCITYNSGSSFICTDLQAARDSVSLTYESAVELFAMLCREYHLDPLANDVILSHREGHARGIASNHSDPEHLWTGTGVNYTMDAFRNSVYSLLKNTNKNEDKNTDSRSEFPPLPFKVKVLIKDLNYRASPSMKGIVKGQTGKGIFTITELSGGWGKLKSGAGWIWLMNPDYCTWR